MKSREQCLPPPMLYGSPWSAQVHLVMLYSRRSQAARFVTRVALRSSGLRSRCGAGSAAGAGRLFRGGAHARRA
jgi:hypothetical protein